MVKQITTPEIIQRFENYKIKSVTNTQLAPERINAENFFKS